MQPAASSKTLLLLLTDHLAEFQNLLLFCAKNTLGHTVSIVKAAEASLTSFSSFGKKMSQKHTRNYVKNRHF